MKNTEELFSESQVEDKFGNNVVIQCPSCKRFYLISEYAGGGKRICPHRKDSTATFVQKGEHWKILVEWGE